MSSLPDISPRTAFQRTIALLLVLLIVSLRALTLETLDLIDPTESRYASVAQEMYLSGDWLIPKLPLPDGTAPYLSKPPLHYWLTAMSYAAFGVDEWTTRLPSFLGLLGIALVVWTIAARTLGRDAAPLATAICLSSSLLYFLAGASVIDVTLTLWITCAIGCFVLMTLSPPSVQSRAWGYGIFIFSALAFLTKGPIGPVLIGLPMVSWILLTRQSKILRGIPWIGGISVFLLLCLPWFFFAEQQSPGMARYFFWNENFSRYLFSDYGDRYVARGPVHPYGSSWWMLAVAFLPWTPVLFVSALHLWRQNDLRGALTENRWIGFALTWGLSGAVFLTFIRQLHSAYLLPSMPGLALIAAHFLQRSEMQRCGRTALVISLRTVITLGLIATMVFIPIGMFYGATWLSSGLSALLIAFFAFCVYRPSKTIERITDLGLYTSAAAAIVFSVAIVQSSAQAGGRKSTEDIMALIADDSDSASTPRVGLMQTNVYSPFWYSRAWQEELSGPVDVVFIRPDKLAASGLDHALVRKHHDHQLSPEILSIFHVSERRGSWVWLTRTPPKG